MTDHSKDDEGDDDDRGAGRAGGREGRIVVRLELTWRAQAELRRVTERTGCTQMTVSSRLIEWFAKQPDVVQAAILGQIPDDVLPEVIELALKKMAEERKGK
jgi:hypothetical protein